MHALSRSRDEARERAFNLLRKVDLEHKANSYPSTLSGGQQQRVAIARALALDPKLMLFDEPTSAIDPEMRVDVLEVMRDLAANGMTMIVATHEMHFAAEVADRVVFLANGHIMEEGLPAQVLKAPSHPRTQKFLKAVLGA
jgi:polar amino acid transport system ATP-binding protein